MAVPRLSGGASALGDARQERQQGRCGGARLKGACQMVGAMSLADVCERIEVAVRAGDSGPIAVAVSDIDREVQRITGYLDAWLSSRP